MNNTKIEWADYTWSPITGCLHECEYCYARGITKRFSKRKGCESLAFSDVSKEETGLLVLNEPAFFGQEETAGSGEWIRVASNPYPRGFEPTFHRYRLNEPQKTKKPSNIFVCSMSDLFGEWVPDEWIQEVFKACEAAPWHRYLFLTKNPKRYETILDRYFPPNFWFGWSQTKPMGKGCLFTTHHSIQSFISLEPLNEEFKEFDIRGLDWAIIGAETGNRKGKIIPKLEWIENIVEQCRTSGVPVFMKDSLAGIWGGELIQEYPWEVQTK